MSGDTTEKPSRALRREASVVVDDILIRVAAATKKEGEQRLLAQEERWSKPEDFSNATDGPLELEGPKNNPNTTTRTRVAFLGRDSMRFKNNKKT